MSDAQPRVLTVASIAVLMMLLAYFTFAIVDTSTKWLLGAGYAAMQLAFFRYSVQLAITCAGLLRQNKRQSWAKARPHLKIVVFRASLLVVSTMLNFLALRHLSLTVTSAIMFTAPILVCALSYPLLGESVGPVRWAAVMFGFLGVMVIVRPLGAEFNWAAILMLLAAVGLALYSILTRKLAHDVDPTILQFFLGATGTIVLAPLAWMSWVAVEGALPLALMISLGVFAWAGHEVLIRAHRLAPANFLMPYTYSYLLYMTLGSILVFQDYPDRWTLAGAAMIAAAGLVIWRREATS